MKIAVIGASGPTGHHIVEQAIVRGHSVVAFVRRRDPRLDSRAVQVEGDVLDHVAVGRAVDDCDAVLSALGSKPSLVHEVNLLSQGTQVVIDALKAAHIRRLIAITGIGAGDSKGHGGLIYDYLVEPLVLRQVYQDKDRQEAVIRESGLDWTIVRPAQLTDEAAEGRYTVFTDLTGVTATSISRADVAAFLLKELEMPNYIGQTPLITN